MTQWDGTYQRKEIRMRTRIAALFTVCLLLAGCGGWSTAPTGVTTATAALHAQAACQGDIPANPCTYWFQWWQDGSDTVHTTPRRAASGTGGTYQDVAETITGLSPGMLYRTQFCGYGDSNVPQPGTCVGQHAGGISQPGYQPDAGDLSASQNFRTAGPGTTATVDLGRPLSTADTADRRISRDAGLSAAWPGGRALWLFGDTAQRNGQTTAGTTAAAGPYIRGELPTALQELPTPPAAPTTGQTEPAPFLPTPQGLSCGAGHPVSWPSGVTAIPGTSTLLITYAEVCAIAPEELPAERLTLARYNPATNQFLSSVTPFSQPSALPPAKVLGSPVYGGDGYLYLFADDVTTTRIIAARVSATASAWGNAANYRWWNGRAWETDPDAAASVATVSFAGSVHVADYTGVGSHRLAMIVQTGFGTGEFQLLEAASPSGPWTPGPSGRVPDPCNRDGYACYALAGHAELSTPGQFWFSWLSPDDLDDFAHLRLGGIAW
jgi:hypothetical protein